ncbi:MAG: site-2 protease family protein [Clostridia bacterium]|nr:site-2 protease family protein [Clostridia bacterium]
MELGCSQWRRLRLNLGSMAGVGITVDPLVVVFAVLYAKAGSLGEWATVFSCMLFHEAAHAVAAAGFGIAVAAIEITPIGAAARLGEDLGGRPEVEAAVAMAGPMASLVMASAGYAVIRYGCVEAAAAEFFVGANLALALFNLLPAFPLDGGRVLRALLVEGRGLPRATAIAASVARAAAAAVTAVGVLGAALGWFNLLVPAIGVFIWIEAGREARSSRLHFDGVRSALRKRSLLRERGAVCAAVVAARWDMPARKLFPVLAGRDLLIISVVGPDGREMGRLYEYEFLLRAAECGPDATVSSLLG